LIRLWTIRTGECENTFDVHEDKVWTLEAIESEPVAEGEVKSEGVFFSGGGDSLFAMWKDVTEAENLLAIVAAEDVLLMEQQFQGDLRRKDYEKALIGAINLKHSLKILNVLGVILEQDNRGDAVTTDNLGAEQLELFEDVWSLRLDPYVAKLSDEHIEVVLVFLKDWNTNSRHCYVSQVLISSFLRVVKIDRMMTFNVFKELIPGLLSYSERHFQRLNRLHQATYMLNYATSLIGLLPVEEAKPVKVLRSITSGSGGDATTEEEGEDEEEDVQIFKRVKTTHSEEKEDSSTETKKSSKKQKV
jgi:U3 small nucleolar RNA-associated protein 13